MATEYTVGLRDMVSGPAAKAAAAAESLRASLSQLESSRASVRIGGRGIGGGAARSVRAEAREKERALAKTARDTERAEMQMLRAEVRRIRTVAREDRRAQAARAAAHRESVGNATSVIGGGVLGMGAAIVAGGAAAMGYVAKQALQTAQLLEGAKMTLSALYGDQKRADETVADLYKFAKKTKFESPDLIKSIVQISTVVKDPYQQKALLGAFSDISTLLNLNGESLQRALVNVQQAFSAGHVETRDLKELILDLPGFNGEELKLAMAELAGITGRNREETIQKLNKAVSNKQIGPKVLVSAFERTVLKQTGKGALGAYAEQMGDTLEGVISNLKSGLGDLFGMASLEKWPAMIDLKNTLKEVSDAFDPATEGGKKLTGALKQMSELVWPVLAVAKGIFSLGVYLAGKPLLVETLGRGIRELGVGLLMVGAIIGGVIAGFFALWGLLEMGVEKLARFSIAAYDAGANFATSLARGIADGIGKVWDAASSIASSAVDAIKTRLHIKSPSRVGMQLGAYTGEGFAIGLSRSAGRVERASADLPVAAVSGMSGGSAGMGRGGASLSITNNINVSGGSSDPSALASQISAAVAAATRSEIERYFGQQLMAGVA